MPTNILMDVEVRLDGDDVLTELLRNVHVSKILDSIAKDAQEKAEIKEWAMDEFDLVEDSK